MRMMFRSAVAAFALGALVVFGTGCPRCPIGASRCANNMTEVCLSNGFWQRTADCAEVAQQSGGDWICCEPSSSNRLQGATCVPAQECQ
jgi:hypothetical protein